MATPCGQNLPLPNQAGEVHTDLEEHWRESFVSNGNITMPHSPHTPSRHRRSSTRSTTWEERGMIALTCRWIVAHQLGIALNLLSILLLLDNLVPRAQEFTQKFTRLSYYNEKTGKYALGRDDVPFVCTWIVLLTGLRAAVIDYILIPFTAWAGIEKRKAKVRFAEQAWLLCHHGTSWSCGMYIWYHSPYWRDLEAMWADFPVRELSWLFKSYYLVALAFWLQQLVVVNIEERRKDHLQMFTHHLITCVLMVGSYCHHYTKIGNVILCLMDVADLFLPLAKIFKYLRFRKVCDVAFGAFMIAWLISRHFLYMRVCWSAYRHIPGPNEDRCYRGSASDLEGPFPLADGYQHLVEPFLDPTGLVCTSSVVLKLFVAVLLALQGIILIWFSMIVKVAYKVVSGEGADDTRSDDEESESEEVVEEIPGGGVTESKGVGVRKNLCLPTSSRPIEKEVDFEDMRISPSPRPFRRRTPAVRRSDGNANSTMTTTSSSPSPSTTTSTTTTGLNLSSTSNRKELLGKIGCDKGS